MHLKLRTIALLAMMMAVVSGCEPLRAYFGVDRPVESLVPQVISIRPHDPLAFTQGLILVDGLLYESTGLYGESTLREVDPDTGEVLRGVALDAAYFGEGLALVGDRLIQLTWQNKVGFVYDRATFDLLRTFPYALDGWGICYDGDHLFTSDGSPQIIERDAETMLPIGEVTVRLNETPIERINELECVEESIYANVWYTDYILRIDKRSGRVTAVIDASGLLTREQRSTLGSGAVLNGIAYDAERETFLITGKRWAWLFEVQFVAR